MNTTMRPKRVMSLVVGVSFLLMGSCQPGGPQRVEIPISKQPPRAMNEEMVERPVSGAAETKPRVETAVAQTPAAGAAKPSAVAVAETAKPQAAAVEKPAPAVVEKP